MKVLALTNAACPAQVFVVEEEDDLSQLTLTINDQEM